MDFKEEALKIHENGKIRVCPTVKVENLKDLSLAYSPGVAYPCIEIKNDKKKAYDYTSKGNTVAVVSDGSAVLGLGNIGAHAAIPVMEGKCVLFKEFAGIDAFPICVNAQDTEKFIEIVKNMEPVFGGINLEDISAPRCFEIEKRLKEELDIPVFHDDQHGTAIVVLAGLLNSLKLTGKKLEEINVVILGAGAAGTAISKLLYKAGVKNITILDSKGIICRRREDLTNHKKRLLDFSNVENISGSICDVIEGKDVFIGISQGNVLSPLEIKKMADKPVVFALANPEPEIEPNLAKEAGAYIVATGRSDYPNQVNNVLAFPGVFRGVLDARVRNITDDMKISAAYGLAECVEPSPEKILPSPMEKNVAKKIAEKIKNPTASGWVY